ncbi:DUF433 domain-containing protein [Candidatus Poriferisodalis sp.]|uniref:DUF433 domain-containing protein n=1 Tax=Candidatus Poriferisodalis sp. TaxID=3101277 RepID=UPI003B011448
MGDVVSLLDREVYVLSQVDRLLDIASGTAKRWIDGYKRRDQMYEPLVRSEPTGSDIVTWGEFVETRLIAEYRRHGVNVARMRPAIMALREEFGTSYPLATAEPFLSTEGRELVMRVQGETGLRPSLCFVVRNQQSLLDLSMEVRRFQQDADYEDSPEVRRLRLLGTSTVVMDPEYGFGEPTIKGRRLRVSAIAEALEAGESRQEIKSLWSITDEMVDDALRCSRVA